MKVFGKDENVSTSLKDSKVQGGVAGRDINKTYYLTEDKASDYMDKLYHDYKEECNTNHNKKEVVEELEHYKSKLEGDVLGLEEKLKRGNISKLYSYAERAKEAFAKKLYFYQNSTMFQK